MAPNTNNIVKLKCPFCGFVLSVRKMPGLESLSIVCPACKQKSHYSAYSMLGDAVVEAPRKPEPIKPVKPVSKRPAELPNPVPESKPEMPIYVEDSAPIQESPVSNHGFGAGPAVPPPMPKNMTIGRLRVLATGVTYQLKFGRNLVGRRANMSNADFKIATSSNRMSREHIVVNVKNDPNVGFVHYISLAKERVNDTFVGNCLLTYGYDMELHEGDIIKLPDVDLIFEFPDVDMTILTL